MRCHSLVSTDRAIIYGTLISDAASLGIEMAGLAKEVAAPSNQRDRPYERLLGEKTFTVFKEWWDKANPDLL